MIEYLNWMGDHPFLGVFLILFVCGVIRLPFSLAKRAIRSRDIRACGWPPPHCDADGDFRSEDEAEEAVA